MALVATASCGTGRGGTDASGEGPDLLEIAPSGVPSSQMETTFNSHPIVNRPIRDGSFRMDSTDHEVSFEYIAGPPECEPLERIDVLESATSVLITVYIRAIGVDNPAGTCADVANYRPISVALSEPLGNRALIDGGQGSMRPGFDD